MWQFAVFIQTKFLEYGVPIVQLYEAGNNAQSCDKESFLTQLGNAKEPSMLHVHLVSRGVPGFCYFPDAPLTGPAPGEIFDLRGTGQEGDGQRKLPWSESARQTLRDFLACQLAELDGSNVF
jgi:hypothetical protein